MPSIRQRLWNASPRQAWEAVRRRLFPRNGSESIPRWVTVAGGPIGGAELFIAPGAVDSWAQMAEGTYDRFFLDVLPGIRSLADSVLWDIGSHFGYHALAFAALSAPNGRIVAFEPNPANQERIRTHLNRNPRLSERITLRNLALSDHVGTAEFLFADHLESGLSSGSHLAGISTPHAEYGSFQRTVVPTSTIDQLVLRENDLPPDVIKIDVEGAESLVLGGGAEFFSRFHPALLIEIHHILEMFRVQKFLVKHRYEIEVLDEAHATPGRCFILAR